MKRKPFRSIWFKWADAGNGTYELLRDNIKSNRCTARVMPPQKEFDERDYHVAIFQPETEVLGGGALAYGYSPTLRGAVNLAEAMLKENVLKHTRLVFDRAVLEKGHK